MTDRRPVTAPYGAWTTPITSARMVDGALRIGEIARSADGAVWWSESRPGDGGRTAVVRRGPDGTVRDVTTPGVDVRTRVHEYGGAAWWLVDVPAEGDGAGGPELWFSDDADHRLYRIRPGGQPIPVTAAPAESQDDRFADGCAGPARDAATCVREQHGPAGEVRNEIVQVDVRGAVEVFVAGPDFVAAPRWSPDGDSLCWLQWNHPHMPWDATELVVRRGGTEIVVAGGPTESVQQPVWGADGTLSFLSDRLDWWNLFRWSPVTGEVESVLVVDGEIGEPPWVFGQSRYALLDDGRVVAAVGRAGFDELVVIDNDGARRTLDVELSTLHQLRPDAGGAVLAVGGSPAAEPTIVRVHIDVTDPAGSVEVLQPPTDHGLDTSWISVPEPVEFATSGGRTAHALVYGPTSPTFAGPPDELPPLLIVVHGGPTSMASPLLDLGVQYWTSRGVMVASVNHGGSTGFGRAYRLQLHKQWGVVDVDDCIACAEHLAACGRVDPTRRAIRGGSAGGFTALAALVRRPDVFAAGATRFGVTDLTLLAADTHKFEARYLDSLIGPLPGAAAVYAARSPITHADDLRTPLVVFHGLDDAVVPPSQSELIVAALGRNGVPHAAMFFPGEGHGFRRAETIRAALDGELSFYAQVLRFELAAEEGITPIEIRR